MAIYDQHNRIMRDLRISVTDRCNFRCRYCMPEEIFGKDYAFLSNEHVLSEEEIGRIAAIFVGLGTQKLRITGGEPLLRKDLASIIERLSSLGAEDLSLTTNGSLLARKATELKAAGLHRITVSLDSLEDDLFLKMNGGRSRVKPVLEGIDAAAAAGLSVKVNMVVQRGFNEDAVVPMVNYFRERGHILRLVEYMDVGNTNGWNREHVVSKQELLDRIGEHWPLEAMAPNYAGEVATRYRFTDGKGEIGFISSVTEAFCGSCTRARLSAEGKLYTCLFATKGHDLRALLRSDMTDSELAQHVSDIWNGRHDRYSLDRGTEAAPDRQGGSKVEMSHIGG
ncbi:GTP 3',8-cyclase MoaA [Paenibacillus hunanensis]|uniref:GTP 3',8-cyclase MoaA n=1 Tax=Paenibacillus hunanensis TaxID=539262 RepID=UPI002A6B7337|nr:GTP 3',8-cyclase MoaA [Paenibacillus hunanensis]WPP42656.1 GTP 3',8-cyclase MoaA [Paenibacillus hunanensis]